MEGAYTRERNGRGVYKFRFVVDGVSNEDAAAISDTKILSGGFVRCYSKSRGG